VSKRRVASALAVLALAGTAPVLLPATNAAAAACSSYPSWVAGRSYNAGDIVRYTDGKAYIAEHANPGYDPVISTWYWEPYACDSGPGTPDARFVVTEAQFNQMFPNRNPFYSYSGLTAALSAYPGFANTGSDTVKKQEAAVATRPAAWCTWWSRTPPTTRTTATGAGPTAVRPARPPTTDAARSS
jgi:hypothetical protein